MISWHGDHVSAEIMACAADALEAYHAAIRAAVERCYCCEGGGVVSKYIVGGGWAQVPCPECRGLRAALAKLEGDHGDDAAQA